MPLHLSDEELSLLTSLAEPIAFGRRHEFLQEVAATIEKAGGVGSGVGVGLVHRVARQVQARFVVSAQRETSIAAEPRHLTARTAAR
jgi:hypothetical protein